PTTVECALPNTFADQIEYFCNNISGRENVIVSLHPHNDRGEGVATCELGLLAGADRVEGTLFGNGERTGNLDVVVVALNMYSHGVDPKLDLTNVPALAEAYKRLTDMEIHPRTPYSGELVYTAFSGSHQDAIRKGMAARATMAENAVWDVPYLPIDPHDIGRQYEGIIRINSQSGKGGAAFILESEFGIQPPKGMHPAIGTAVKDAADKAQRELKPQEILDIFEEKWLKVRSPLKLEELVETHLEGSAGEEPEERVLCNADVVYNGQKYKISAQGNGPLDAFASAIQQTPAPKFNITSFHEHSISMGSGAKAMAYVQITKEDGSQAWGVGRSSNVGRAGIYAVISALNQ
ncbi:MAG: 2-isopropylmalate synthase, partial [Treponema sp.]|nr:2-isopropylmalate synthase [Treponema sp.]